MLKKILGGFSVFLFVFAIVMPLLVTTDTAHSTPNKRIFYRCEITTVCPDGSVLSRDTEWRSMLVTDSDHPPDGEFCYDTGQGIRCDPVHANHGIRDVINHGLTKITRYASARACR